MATKTAAAVLHEMMVKQGRDNEPEFICVSESGPQHMMMFEMVCKARGEKTSAIAGTKKQAKQEAARAMLTKLAEKGHGVPAPFGLGNAAAAANVDALPVKTAAAVLQEVMIKNGVTPVYELVARLGPAHMTQFEMSCEALGVSAKGTARSKKEAKQVAAKGMLAKLSQQGYDVPAPFRQGASVAALEAEENGAGLVARGTDTRSFMALLNDYCRDHHLPQPACTLREESGPSHQRSFTLCVSVGAHTQQATAHTKKGARQAAAEALYNMRASLHYPKEGAVKANRAGDHA